MQWRTNLYTHIFYIHTHPCMCMRTHTHMLAHTCQTHSCLSSTWEEEGETHLPGGLYECIQRIWCIRSILWNRSRCLMRRERKPFQNHGSSTTFRRSSILCPDGRCTRYWERPGLMGQSDNLRAGPTCIEDSYFICTCLLYPWDHSTRWEWPQLTCSTDEALKV